jgi:hypothetical protein
MIDFDAKKRQGFMARQGYIKVQCEGPGNPHYFEIHEVNADIIKRSGKPVLCPKCQKAANVAKLNLSSGTPETVDRVIPREQWNNFMTALYMVTALEHLWFKNEKFPFKIRDLKKLVRAGF